MDGTQGGPAAAVALSGPGALDDPAVARQVLTGAATRTPRWAAEQVIGTLPPAVPVDDDVDEDADEDADDDVVLAAALRSMPAGTRAAAVLQLLDGEAPVPSPPPTGPVDGSSTDASVLVETDLAG